MLFLERCIHPSAGKNADLVFIVHDNKLQQQVLFLLVFVFFPPNFHCQICGNWLMNKPLKSMCKGIGIAAEAQQIPQFSDS